MTGCPVSCWLALALTLTLATGVSVADGSGVEYLGGRVARGSIEHHQQWGQLGVDRAASRSGSGQPLRLGGRIYEKGLGHHASGEVVVPLGGRYRAFRATVGVQWQGGQRGSVVFRVAVDGEVAFESRKMSDSDPPREVSVSLENARELRLIASDGGDGIACDMANWIEARLVVDPRRPLFAPVRVSLNGEPAPPRSAAVGGFSMIAGVAGPQVAVMEPARRLTASVRPGEEVRVAIPVHAVESRDQDGVLKPLRLAATATVVQGGPVEVLLSLDGGVPCRRVLDRGAARLEVARQIRTGSTTILLITRGAGGEAGVRWHGLVWDLGGESLEVPLEFPAGKAGQFPPPLLPDPRRPIEQELIEWDWRLQDGIGTAREPRTWAEAIARTLERGDELIRDLEGRGVLPGDLAGPWERCRAEWRGLAARADDSRAEDLWRRVHRLRRRIALGNPLADVGPLLFVKRVPSCFSHQLTQYYGKCARPGGGIFVLDAPGESMECRRLVALPPGSCQHPEVSFDGRRVLFAFTAADTAPEHWQARPERHYHLHEMNADGSNLRRLTDGPFDDFSPRYLPDGRILFLSTRRGGFHRCGAGPCEVYTLAIAEADGSHPRVLSHHETHEWDPAVLNDGRIIYTRWDYVDRNAVFYQQLWTVRPDGSDVRIFYGNNTLNPVGIWEARPVPGSTRVMATAAAHHAMTAGSIILLDVARGADGAGAITRLTPDALFPESEFPVYQWHAPAGVAAPPPVPPAARRWPGHCYRSPHPLSETYFLAAYSFDRLVGEPRANRANMFGIYLVDRFGNKELLYRDLDISSLWPVPLRGRKRPPALMSSLEETGRPEGTFFLQNVHESWPALPAESRIRRLRILQVLPKTTPHINRPRVGLANASPGKQVLGTVPVEPDGSAYFRAPAGVPLSFQALDGRGRAVQTMRSLTYLQPGENASCIGCHEYRSRAPAPRPRAQALARPPATITPGPPGSRPFSYPILVQPVLDRKCVACHRPAKAAGGIVLTGEPEGAFTRSYNALAPRVPYAEWKSAGFPASNSEPLTRPGFFGARGSKLLALLLDGHEGVELDGDDLERLITWMDTNALFYGTFDPSDQKRQQRGERIEGPALE